MLNIFISLTLLVQVLVALLIILVVLMQRPKQEGLGAAFGAGMTDQMFGAQTTNVLQKATVWLGITFFVSTLLLTILYNRKNTAKAITSDPVSVKAVPTVTAPVSAPEGESLASQLLAAENTPTSVSSSEIDPELVLKNEASALKEESPSANPLSAPEVKVEVSEQNSSSDSLLQQLESAGESLEKKVNTAVSPITDPSETTPKE